MRKTIIGIALAALLSACTTTGTYDPAKLQELVDKIKVYTAQTCNLLPEAAGVVALISAFYPNAVIAGDVINVIGNAICNAQPAMSIRKGAQYGVRVVKAPNGKSVQVRVSPAR